MLRSLNIFLNIVTPTCSSICRVGFVYTSWLRTNSIIDRTSHFLTFAVNQMVALALQWVLASSRCPRGVRHDLIPGACCHIAFSSYYRGNCESDFAATGCTIKNWGCGGSNGADTCVLHRILAEWIDRKRIRDALSEGIYVVWTSNDWHLTSKIHYKYIGSRTRIRWPCWSLLRNDQFGWTPRRYR